MSEAKTNDKGLIAYQSLESIAKQAAVDYVTINKAKKLCGVIRKYSPHRMKDAGKLLFLIASKPGVTR